MSIVETSKVLKISEKIIKNLLVQKGFFVATEVFSLNKYVKEDIDFIKNNETVILNYLQNQWNGVLGNILDFNFDDVRQEVIYTLEDEGNIYYKVIHNIYLKELKYDDMVSPYSKKELVFIKNHIDTIFQRSLHSLETIISFETLKNETNKLQKRITHEEL